MNVERRQTLDTVERWLLLNFGRSGTLDAIESWTQWNVGRRGKLDAIERWTQWNVGSCGTLGAVKLVLLKPSSFRNQLELVSNQVPGLNVNCILLYYGFVQCVILINKGFVTNTSLPLAYRCIKLLPVPLTHTHRHMHTNNTHAVIGIKRDAANWAIIQSCLQLKQSGSNFYLLLFSACGQTVTFWS